MLKLCKLVNFDAETKRTLTFVMNHDVGIKNEIYKILSENDEGITRVIGDNRIIIAARRSKSIASMLFQ